MTADAGRSLAPRISDKLTGTALAELAECMLFSLPQNAVGLPEGVLTGWWHAKRKFQRLAPEAPSSRTRKPAKHREPLLRGGQIEGVVLARVALTTLDGLRLILLTYIRRRRLRPVSVWPFMSCASSTNSATSRLFLRTFSPVTLALLVAGSAHRVLLGEGS